MQEDSSTAISRLSQAGQFHIASVTDNELYSTFIVHLYTSSLFNGTCQCVVCSYAVPCSLIVLAHLFRLSGYKDWMLRHMWRLCQHFNDHLQTVVHAHLQGLLRAHYVCLQLVHVL